MAPFNPLPPDTQDPNYMNYARVIDPPAPDLSKSILIGTAKDAISGGAQFIDASIKKGIDNEIYSSVDKERDQFTAGLEQIKNELDNGNIPAAAQGITGKTVGSNLLDSNAEMLDDDEVPPDITEGIDRVTDLSAARRAGSARLNDTLYSANVLSIAKRLRNQYGSGYRDYIDQRISQASGLPVANSYYNNLVQDINRQLNAVARQKDDIGNIMNWGLKQGIPQMGEYIVRRRAGDPKITDAMILQKVQDWTVLKSQQGIDAANRTARNDDQAQAEKREEKALTRSLNGAVNMIITDQMNLAGLPSWNSLQTYFQDVTAGKILADDTNVQQQAMYLQNYRDYAYNTLKKLSQGPDEYLGGEKAERMITAAMAPIDNFILLVNDKDKGPAYFHNRMNKAIPEDDFHNNWLANKDRGAITRQFMGARRALGEQYFPEYIRSIVTNGADQSVKDAFSQEALSAVMPITDARGQPVPRYMKDAIQNGKAKGIPDDSGFYGSVISWAEKLTDPMMPMSSKDTMIEWAFGAKNQGVLKEFNMDYRDPNTGEWVAGRYRAFNVMTSPAIYGAVAETAKYKPENYDKMLKWVENEYATLYREDLKTLNKILEKPYLNIHFGWDKENNSYVLLDKTGKVLTRNERAMAIEQPNQVYINGMLDVVERINGANQRVAAVQALNPNGAPEGGMGTYLLRLNQVAGFRPGGLDRATERMSAALIKARAPDLVPEQFNDRDLKKSKPVPAQGLE